MKSVQYITREFELLEEALEEQGQSEQRRLRIFMGGILATLAVHVLFKFIAAWKLDVIELVSNHI